MGGRPRYFARGVARRQLGTNLPKGRGHPAGCLGRWVPPRALIDPYLEKVRWLAHRPVCGPLNGRR